MNNLFNYFENLNSNNKLGQAFLIGNVLFDEIEEELSLILRKIIFNNKVNIKDNPDVYILQQTDTIISKDDIKELLNKLSTTSQFNNKKVYIIDESEKLSDTVYNAILKTLEEPENGIYAFLLTNNIDAVKPTIVSRCQKIFLSSSKEQSKENFEIEEIVKEFTRNIEKDGVECIAKYHKIYNLINDRNKLISILENMLLAYNKSLKILINNEKTTDYDYIINNNDIVSISKKILVINDKINKLSNYLNKNLSIDSFIIDMWRCNL